MVTAIIRIYSGRNVGAVSACGHDYAFHLQGIRSQVSGQQNASIGPGGPTLRSCAEILACVIAKAPIARRLSNTNLFTFRGVFTASPFFFLA